MKSHPWDKNFLETYEFKENVPVHGLVDAEGLPVLTGIHGERVARYVLVMVRDPLCGYQEGALADAARKLEDVEVVGNSGMFETITGTYRSARLSIIVGGSGGPEAELALMDLFEHSEADTFIRVGGSGGVGFGVKPGDIVITHGCVRDEGLTAAYVPQSYPAVANIDVVTALQNAAVETGVRYHIGLTRSTDSDFVQFGRPAAGGFLPQHQRTALKQWARAGVLNGDRETAAILVLSSLYGKRAGSICSVADNVVTGDKFELGSGHVAAIDVALEGVAKLHDLDNQQKLENKIQYKRRRNEEEVC